MAGRIVPHRKGTVRVLTQALIPGGKPRVAVTCEERPFEGRRDGVIQAASILLPLQRIEPPRNEALGLEILAMHIEAIPADLRWCTAGGLSQAEGATQEELLQDGAALLLRTPQQRELAGGNTCVGRKHGRSRRARPDVPDLSRNGRPRRHSGLDAGWQHKPRGWIQVDRRVHGEAPDTRLLGCIRGGGQEEPTPHLARKCSQASVGPIRGPERCTVRMPGRAVDTSDTTVQGNGTA